jgi:hypothetical protein
MRFHRGGAARPWVGPTKYALARPWEAFSWFGRQLLRPVDGGCLLAPGVAERQVAGAEGQLVNLQVGDELSQQPPRPVEAGEIAAERRVQIGHPRPQRPPPRGGHFPPAAATGAPGRR